MSDQRCSTQGRIGAALCLLVLGLSLAACGKKPGSVDPPDNVTNDTFPLTYPDPTTDPAATYGAKDHAQ
jgi:hypothetical protein